MVEFDYIIVGAGPSAMGLLHGLLEPFLNYNNDNNDSNDENNNDSEKFLLPFTIAIVERGPPSSLELLEDDIKVKIVYNDNNDLNRWFQVSHDPSSPYVTILQSKLVGLVGGEGNTKQQQREPPVPHQQHHHRIVDVPIGCGVGGGSNINAGLCMMPNTSSNDFDQWLEPIRSLMPTSLQYIQNYLIQNDYLWNAVKGQKLEENHDKKNIDGDQNENIVPCLATKQQQQQQPKLQRINYYHCLIKPLLLGRRFSPRIRQDSTRTIRGIQQPQKQQHKMINWFCHMEVQRLLYDDDTTTTTNNNDNNNTAVAVRGIEIYNRFNDTYTVLQARREVILCAGAIETPALLIVSGVGPNKKNNNNVYKPNDDDADEGDKRSSQQKPQEQQQQQHQPTVLVELSGVGQNLCDHVILPRVLSGPPPSSSFYSSINGIHNICPFTVDGDGGNGDDGDNNNNNDKKNKSQYKFLLLTSTTTPEIAVHFVIRILYQYYYYYYNYFNYIVFRSTSNNIVVLVKRMFDLVWFVLELILHFLILYTPIYLILKYGFTTMNLALMNPKSRGSLCLKRKVKHHAKIKEQGATKEQRAEGGCSDILNITTSYLSPHRRKDFEIDLRLSYVEHWEDLEALWRGWIATRILSDNSSSSSRRLEIFPGFLFQFLYKWFAFSHIDEDTNTAKITSNIINNNSEGGNEGKKIIVKPLLKNAWFSLFARDTNLPFFHWCGTCAMKTMDPTTNTTTATSSNEQNWVVDSRLRVRSTQNLRICDASVFPGNLSVPPALTCAAMGHALGNIIIREIIENSKKSKNIKKVKTS